MTLLKILLNRVMLMTKLEVKIALLHRTSSSSSSCGGPFFHNLGLASCRYFVSLLNREQWKHGFRQPRRWKTVYAENGEKVALLFSRNFLKLASHRVDMYISYHSILLSRGKVWHFINLTIWELIFGEIFPKIVNPKWPMLLVLLAGSCNKYRLFWRAGASHIFQ